MATIKALKTKLEDGTEQVVFPKTLPEAIIDPETGKTLDSILNDINEKISNSNTDIKNTTYELSRTEDTITLTGSDGSSSEITDSSAYLSRENLLVYPYHDNTSTIYGVTFTVNNDGTITANGESTSSYSAFSISTRHADSNPLIVLPKGTYTLSGCPTGGGETTYCIQIGIDSNGSWKTIATDTGNGAIFTLTEETQIAINCPIMSGVTVENLIFKPMLEVGTVAHEYQPYNLSRQKLRSDLDNINTDVNVSDKVSKSGDTMTGTLEISNGSFPALVLKHTGKDGGTTAGMQFKNSNGVLGGIGMPNKGNELRRWNKDLTTSYEILDSGNYSNYALPLTGGTFTGDVTFEKNIVSTTGHNFFYNGLMNARFTSSGTAGYWKFLTVKAVSGCTYAGSIISFKVTQRGGRGLVNLYISNGATANTGFSIGMSQEVGAGQCYFIQSSTGVFDIYLKHDAWAEATITDLVFPQYQRNRFTLTWSNTHVDSLPSGTTAVTTYTVLDTTNYSSNIPSATQSAVGLMSAADKKKLDGIASGANAYSLPTASSSTLGGVKTTSKVTSTSGLTPCPIISGVPYYKDTNTTYSAATTSANGLMTAAMVTKLNGIATGANKITVDGSMSTTSTNPVQNKIIQAQLPTSNKNASSGYIRFPSAKIQIAWIKKSVTTTITTVWGKTYETASAVDIGSWSAAFSAVPVVSYDAYVSEGSCDLSVNKFTGPTTTTAGSVYLARASALTPARTFVVTAFAVGTYA